MKIVRFAVDAGVVVRDVRWPLGWSEGRCCLLEAERGIVRGALLKQRCDELAVAATAVLCAGRTAEDVSAFATRRTADLQDMVER